MEYIDYLIMDFKHYDTDVLRKYTGVGNEVVCRNFENNCAMARQQHIRIPLINGVNTQNPEKFAEYFSSFDTSCTVFEFLRYHEYGKEKWTEDYKVQDGFVSDEVLKNFENIFKNKGLKLIKT